VVFLQTDKRSCSTFSTWSMSRFATLPELKVRPPKKCFDQLMDELR